MNHKQNDKIYAPQLKKYIPFSMINNGCFVNRTIYGGNLYRLYHYRYKGDVFPILCESLAGEQATTEVLHKTAEKLYKDKQEQE